MSYPPPPFGHYLLTYTPKKYARSTALSDEQRAIREEAEMNRAKKALRTKRRCIGPLCRGKKTFLSTGPGNRQCPRCLAATAREGGAFTL